MKDRAFAKINLSLDVVKRRDDGYHELEMIMVPINFYDLVEITFSEEMEFHSNARYIPKNIEGNTVLKAISLLRDKYHFVQNFKIVVTKHVPTRAGLGGGSADAASTIRIVNKLLNLQMTQAEMLSIAKEVGADVPFCILNKCAHVKGIGEKLSVFTNNSDFHVLLVKPKKGISTKKSFESLNLQTCDHPDCNLVKSALENNDYQKLITNLKNSLEQPSFQIVTSIEDIKNELLNLGLDASLMSGSGSTVFALSKDLNVVKNAAINMRKKGYFTRITNILK